MGCVCYAIACVVFCCVCGLRIGVGVLDFDLLFNLSLGVAWFSICLGFSLRID